MALKPCRPGLSRDHEKYGNNRCRLATTAAKAKTAKPAAKTAKPAAKTAKTGAKECPPCPSSKVCNAESGRCVLRTGVVGKRVLAGSQPTKPANPGALKPQIDADIDTVVNEMRKPGMTRRGSNKTHYGIQGITREARDEIAKVVGPLYRGVVPKESFYGGVLVSTHQGNTPLHVIEDILRLAGNAARDRGKGIIEGRDIRKVLEHNGQVYNFTAQPTQPAGKVHRQPKKSKKGIVVNASRRVHPDTKKVQALPKGRLSPAGHSRNYKGKMAIGEDGRHWVSAAKGTSWVWKKATKAQLAAAGL